VASVVVAGGGLAGLVCAWRLGRAGHDVEVLEREDEPGGSARSEHRLGFRLDRRPSFVLRGDRNLRALLAALGLEASLVPMVRPCIGILCDGRIHTCDARSALRLLLSAPLGAGALLRCLRVGLDLARQRRLLDPSRPESAAPLDDPSARTELRRRAGDEAWDRLLAPALAAATGTAPATLSVAVALLWLRRAAAGLAPHHLEGGASPLVAALAARIGVRTGCEVFRIETETDGARVRYRSGGSEQSVLADAVVVALPGPLVASLCPKLTPVERGCFDAQHFTPHAAVQLLVDRRPAGGPALVLVPEREGLGLAVLLQEPGAAPSGAGVLRAVLDEASARELLLAPDAEIVAHALRGIERTPFAGLEVAHAVVRRSAHGVPRFAPGSLRRLAAFASRVDRSPRLAFAGEVLLGRGLEGDVTSGMRAATDVARCL
jgi:oxygen-dependent protoporphyrinogen oxidase